MWMLLTALAVAQVADTTPEPRDTWAVVAPRLGAVAGESTSHAAPFAPDAVPVTYQVYGVVSRVPLDVRLVPEGDLIVATMRDQTATLERTEQLGWKVRGGDGVITEVLHALLDVGPSSVDTPWTVGETALVQHTYASHPEPDPMSFINACSCPQSVTHERRATDMVVAADGWPVLAVIVNEWRTTVLPGGAQHWGGSEARWERVTWIQKDGPVSIERPLGPVRGSWSKMEDPSILREAR